jgi:hypothetical protein
MNLAELPPGVLRDRVVRDGRELFRRKAKRDRRENQRAWRAKNREHCRAWRHAWDAKNKERRNAYHRAWRARNKDKEHVYSRRRARKKKAYDRAYYLKNREAILAKNLRWKENNPARWAAYRKIYEEQRKAWRAQGRRA